MPSFLSKTLRLKHWKATWSPFFMNFTYSLISGPFNMRSFGDIPLSFERQAKERAFGMIKISWTHIETHPKTPLTPFDQNVLED
jgi:hypothetical protein